MREALKEATKAYEEGEVPVGAIVVCNNQIIARGYNQVEKLHDATAHAEMLALTAAFNYSGGKYLQTCTLYVTLEPCVMCACATYWAQLDRLVFGANDEKRGYRLLQKPLLHPQTTVCTGVLAGESKRFLKKFFQKLRSSYL